MSVNYGVCDKCHQRVPASHSVRDGKVYLTKQCPDCGTTEGLVSNDPATWQRKREIWQYDSATSTAHVCHLKCEACCHPRSLKLVFLDLTNRCNMNCPICVANAPWMGFDYHPPLPYFDNVLNGLAKLDPKPVIHLFGGEPTLRDDLFTNGLKLADEAYCKRVCDKKLPVFLGFDGRDPSIYARMRKTSACYEPKLKALANLQKFATQRQDAIMCTVARHINDAHIADLFAMCYEHRNHIKALNFLPLTETWEPGRFEPDISTTIEDVQEIVAAAFPDDKVEFASLGLQFHFDRALSFFRSGGARTFNKVHPNCEAATIFVPDGERYRPVSHFLKRPLDELAAEAVNIAKSIEPKLAGLNPTRGLSRLRGKLIVLRTFLPFIRRNVNFRRLMKGSPWLTIPRLLGGLILGKTLYDQLARHTYIGERLTSIILPFEEIHSIESERMEMCAAGFACEDTATGEVRTVPACVWWLYNKPILQSIMAKYCPPARA